MSDILNFVPKKNLTFGNYYWNFEEGLSSEDCDAILNSVNRDYEEAAIFDPNDGGLIKNKAWRKTGMFSDNQQFIYDLVWPYMLAANENAEWNFDLESAENYQILKYEVGDFYDWHMDGCGTGASVARDKARPHIDGKARKLSMSLILNDDYEGGDLILYDGGTMKQNKGSMVFFPSYLHHKVSPVTKGTRYSLVMWFLGPPLR